MPESKYNIDTTHDDEYIYINLHDFNTRAYTEFKEDLWELVSTSTWTINNFYDVEKTKPRYLKSGKLKKTFHQLVMDFYFGEDVRLEAYHNGMIIDHIRNDSSLDCRLSNLYFLLGTRNKYKGQLYDKYTQESLPFYALRVFHIVENGTFQITIGFTADAKLTTVPNKPLQSMKFLYEDIDYWNVIQDAETMICSLKEQGKLMLDRGLYRYKDMKIEYGEYIQPTEEEKKLDLKAGCLIWRDGEPFMISRCDGIFRIDEVPYERDWTTKEN